MTENMRYLVNTVTGVINTRFGNDMPSLEQIHEEAERLRNALSGIYPVTDDEFNQVKQNLATNILHTIGYSITLRGRDSNHQSWYYIEDNDGYYWNRYKTYLRNIRHWGTDIVARLNETTNGVMDDLGNPKDHNRPFQRRGLLLGDVQSGKTATYTAICNKASDAGYRVIIVLAGMMENLRVQTQARLDAEFVGIESKYTFDQHADQEIRNTPVGVGQIPPFIHEKRITRFTSVTTDFNKAILHAVGLSLRTLNGTALFVVKKNKSVLNHLHNWLVENNADHESGIIDLPLLLIDDEADNASVNTNSEDKNPTAINQAIRNILNCFRQASYIGITATPFANIFIDPDPGDDGAARDLFPKDFLTVLPSPERYIGTVELFGNGDADEWSDGGRLTTSEGPYSSAVVPIDSAEQDHFFRFRHNKELADVLYDIPASMEEAIRYFILVTGISDLRKDVNEHRSMLVNVSRFTLVQNRLTELVDAFISRIESDLENYSQMELNQAMLIESIRALHTVWGKYSLADRALIEWPEFLKTYLFRAIRRIEVRAVNQQTGAASLNYYEYQKAGMRVIAVGGNSLSRGLTLEGLCVSYFYRNSMMYDTLLQMGRWFGYRPNYEDLFKIWMAEDAIDWFGYITDAVNELKGELKQMRLQNQTPEEFGLKVRQAPGALLITARNKMRTGVSVSRPITVSGRMLETPRLRGDTDTIQSNENECRAILRSICENEDVTSVEYDANTRAYIWKMVPKKKIIDLIRNFKTHPWNLNFQPIALADYIYGDNGPLEFWDVAIPQGSDTDQEVTLDLTGSTITVHPVGKRLEWDVNVKNMLKVYGRHVRIGSGGCTKIGLGKEEINRLRREHGSSKDSTFLKTKRRPLALIHIIKNNNGSRLVNDPDVVFALGLGFPYDGAERKANYVVTPKELENWVDIPEDDFEDDDD